MSKIRVIFAGTPDFAVPSLAALLDAGLEVVAVYTQPDRPAGRGQKLQASPVKALAQVHAIPVFQPESLKRDADAAAQLRALDADLMVVVAYGLLLPVAVLEAPRLGCLNVHASLLPRWRGAAPIQRAVLAGDAQSGVCIMGMEAGLDTGPVYHRVETPIGPRETGGSLHDRLATLGASALLTALPGILDGSSLPVPQDDALATYARKLTKEEARINWTQSADAIERQVRAFDPWPVAQTSLDGAVLRVWGAEANERATTSSAPGDVIAADKTGIVVATGRGTLRITRLQLAGKKPMSATDFLNARHLEDKRFG
ncbi:methionyl-tRNA formyltransferase [Thiocystis minor]|uniref:methionyl-tRNA formyltransferase n=1 Tax=Thiocystis minor TaxID=61597 RepID=UPI001912C4CC|nr:methionyl-tRNA formyltransferase [Thiocystis minor]MBK5966838.1 methionyl-tRNA formyltransferase [Thiocystis minor]